MAQQQRRQPTRKSKRQILRQRQLAVIGTVVVIFLIIFGLGALWGRGMSGGVNEEKIAQAVQGLGQTVQVDYDYTRVLQQEARDDAYYGWENAADRGAFTIMYQGSMDIGTDTTKVTKDNIAISGKTVTVTVPDIAILTHEIAQDSITCYDEDENKFNPITLGQFDEFCADQKSVVENEVYNTDKVKKAEERLTNVISIAVKNMGKFDNVTVKFANG